MSSVHTGKTFRFGRTDGEGIEVQPLGNPNGASLSKVTLANKSTSVSVTRESQKSYLSLSLRAPNHEVNQMPPADLDEQVDLVTEQLSRGGKNSLFREVWPLFSEMLEMNQSGEYVEGGVQFFGMRKGTSRNLAALFSAFAITERSSRQKTGFGTGRVVLRKRPPDIESVGAC